MASNHVASFGVRFCNELYNDKNCICSPLSAETLLALVALGSSNESREEIFKALGIPDENDLRSKFKSLTTTLASKESVNEPPTTKHEPSDSQHNAKVKNRDNIFLQLRSKFTSLTTTLASTKPTVKPPTSKRSRYMCEEPERDAILKIANKIYVKQGKAVKSDLIKVAEDVFQSSLEQIDFSRSSEAAKAINNWVANQTNDIIKDIVSANVLNEDTGLVLVNAIYFHGFWKIPFKANDTYTRKFHVNKNNTIKIEQMSLEGKCLNYKHSPELKAKILRMFYEGGTASMVIVLPDEIEGLNDVMKRLTAGYDLNPDIKSLKETYLKVVIPKFKIETEINLKQLLPKMGIQAIFDPMKSDINMLSSEERLYVSEAIQKAFIAVDEKGTEAAAASYMGMQLCCAPYWTDEFIADRPFLFILTAHKVAIFYGTFHGNQNPK